MVSASPTTRQRERLPTNMSPLHRFGGTASYGTLKHLQSQNNLRMLTTNSPQGCFTLYIFVYLVSGVDVWPPQLSALCVTICLCLSGSMKLLLRPCRRTLARDNAKSYNPREEPNAGLDHRENYVYFNYRQRSRQILVKHLSPDPR